MTYAQRLADGDAARSDPNGFYHGMTVTHAGAHLRPYLKGPHQSCPILALVR